jgi:hypothetical protein
MVAVPIEQRDFCRLPDRRVVDRHVGADPGHGQRKGDVALLQPFGQPVRPSLVVGQEHHDVESMRGEFRRHQFQQAAQRVISAACPAQNEHLASHVRLVPSSGPV